MQTKTTSTAGARTQIEAAVGQTLDMTAWQQSAGRGYAYAEDGVTTVLPELAKLNEATLGAVEDIAKESYLTGFARAVYLMASGLGLDPQTVSDKMQEAYIRCNRASGRKQWEPCFRESLGI